MRKPRGDYVKTAEIEHFPPGWSDARALALDAGQRVVHEKRARRLRPLSRERFEALFGDLPRDGEG